MTIGLTGGIGCGKSSVLPAFEKIGFAVIDSDKIARDIRSAPETARFAKERFGDAVIDANGAIDAPALAKIVFADKRARTDLEAFMHPRIREAWKNFAKAAERAGNDAAVEVPLLFEKNYDADFDATVCVAASTETRLSRIEKRGLPREQARARIAAQMPLDEQIRRADIVIFNDGSREFLTTQVEEIVARLRRRKKN